MKATEPIAVLELATRRVARGSVRYVAQITLVATFGGFLLGYDTAVVSDAIGFLSKRFALSADLTGWASSMLVGCMAGAVVAGPVGDRHGGKPSLLFCAILFALSSVASAAPQMLSQFAWARYIQSAKLNGRDLNRWWIKQKDMVQGGTLSLELGHEPNQQWARGCAPDF